MKTLLILLLPLHLMAQNIGDSYHSITRNDSLQIEHYRLLDNYFELVVYYDDHITVFLSDYKARKIFGIDYIYPDIDNQSERLSGIKNGAYEIGNGVWIKQNVIITQRENEIILRDVRYIKKNRLHRQAE